MLSPMRKVTVPTIVLIIILFVLYGEDFIKFKKALIAG